ncbi:MAG: DUF3987 domain-containing protein [Alphaproteobacteria bacterium]|nr:DUF3987 domain-containing protein [Alphaproteobacteria bacterium]
MENARKNLNVNSTKDEWKAINNMELNLKPPKALPELILTDVTSESLLTSLKEQENKISIISDEGGVLDVIGGLYNNGRSNIDVVLKGWDGGRIHVRRSNQNYTLTPIITFCLAVQPDFLEKISKNNTFNGRGFFERFLYCIPEQRTTPKMYLNKTVPQQIISDYNDKITELLKLPYNPNEPTYLTLSSDADCVWRNFRRDMSRNSINNGKFSICDKWAGKLGSQVLRIAGLLHLAKVGLTSTSIDDITMLDAIIFANKLHMRIISNIQEKIMANIQHKNQWKGIHPF